MYKLGTVIFFGRWYRMVQQSEGFPRDSAPQSTQEVSTRPEDDQQLVFLPPLSTLSAPLNEPEVAALGAPLPAAGERINIQLRTLKSVPEASQNEQQKQLFADLAFVAQFSTLSEEVKRTLTPADLHTIVEKVQRWLGLEGDDTPTVLSPSTEFQARVREIAETAATRANRRDVVAQRARKALSGTHAHQEQDITPLFAEASKHLRKTDLLRQEGYKITVAGREGSDRSQQAMLQTAFDLARAECFRAYHPNPFVVNLEAWEANKRILVEWWDEVADTVRPLALSDSFSSLRSLIQAVISRFDELQPMTREDIIDLRAAVDAVRSQQKIAQLVASLREELEKKQSQQATAIEVAVPPEVVAVISESGAIPDLLPQLQTVHSMHWHRYSSEGTVRTLAEEAKKLDENQRTAEQTQLLQDIVFLTRFTGENQEYQSVYNPEELHLLVLQLKALLQKNRPDFNDLEHRLLAVLQDNRAVVGTEERLLEGVAERAERDEPNRVGMIWDSLTRLSKVASEFIRLGSSDKHGSQIGDYLITVYDPESRNHPDLTEVFQAATDLFARDVIGERAKQADAIRQRDFVVNAGVIHTWLESVSGVMNAVPVDSELGKRWQKIVQLIATMNARLNGNELSGPNKHYRQDVVGALRLQLLIGHQVRELKQTVQTLADGDQDQTDDLTITPLE